MAEPMFDVVPTPNPKERGFWVRVSSAEYKPSKQPVPQETTYRAFQLDEGTRMNEEFGGFIFTVVRPAQTPGFLRYYFLPPKTDAEMKQHFDEARHTDAHSWLPILNALIITADDSLPLSATAVRNGAEGVVNGPRYYVNEDFIPDADEGTLVIVRKFYAPRHHRIPQHPAPIGTAVSYDLPGGVSGRFPKCLHQDIAIDPARTGTALLVGETATALSGSTNGQHFPRTNFRGWSPYVFADRESDPDELGGYLRTMMIAVPPATPRRILQRN